MARVARYKRVPDEAQHAETHKGAHTMEVLGTVALVIIAIACLPIVFRIVWWIAGFIFDLILQDIFG